MDVILMAGLWLRAVVWEEVAAELRRLGHRPAAVELPGADDGSTTATLEDQVGVALAAVDAASRPMVVGHSVAATLAWIVADRRSTSIDRVVLIGGFPGADGGTYADLFPVVDGVTPFPGWEPFAGPDSADLDTTTREGLAAGAVPVPAAVARGVVRLTDSRRYDVPVTVVCPEFSADQAREWVAGGEVPELGAVRDVSFVDIDSGHWPMLTRPAELARLIHAAASEA